MSLFNSSNYYLQRDNINEDSNRIINMWNFVVNFTNYLDVKGNVDDMNKIFMYNVKSVELPKYTMKTYKRYYGTSERSFPIKRVSDGSFKVTFYGRYDIIYALSRIGQNFVGSEEVTQNIDKTMQANERLNLARVYKEIYNTNGYIEILQLPDTLKLNENFKISYKYMMPVLSSIEYNELNSENNGILEITCEFMYKDYRITTDSLYSKDKLTMYGNNDTNTIVYDYIDLWDMKKIDKRNNPKHTTDDSSTADADV